MNFKTFKEFFLFGAVLLSAASCVDIDETLGSSFIPANQQYDVAMCEFKLNDVRMGYSDSLSAYSSSRITIGAVRDETFGLTTRSSAFTVYPLVDTLNVGLDPQVVQFHFTVTRDTTSVPEANQQNILQSINVYELNRTLDSTYLYVCDDRYEEFYDSSTRITKGVPVYDGGDSLSFDFSDEYAEKMISVFQEDPDIQMDQSAFLKKMPGIYMTVDAPVGNGGRINMFDCPIEVDEDYYYVTGCYAELKIKTKYEEDGEVQDTSFLFWFGPVLSDEDEDDDDDDYDITDTDQYAFNICYHESRSGLFSPDENGFVQADDVIYIEGGAGLKPWFSATEMRDSMLSELAAKGLDPGEVIINKATIVMNYNEPEDYDKYYLMPPYLGPTTKFSYSIDYYKEDGNEIRYVYYANLTDASISDEDQGDINRSLAQYTPDITHHMQEILTTSDDSLATGKYDVWMMVLADETSTTSTDYSDLAEYYTYLAYSSYYSSMYSSSYSSSSYSNYYYYLYLASLYTDYEETYTNATLDKDRYYTATLKGPTSDDGPKLKITYAYIKQDADAEEESE